MPAAAAALQQDPGKALRVAGAHYRRVVKGAAVGAIWTGTAWRCEHGRQRTQCKPCTGTKRRKLGGSAMAVVGHDANGTIAQAPSPPSPPPSCTLWAALVAHGR